jgi:REP-associated tyrosine transposase
VVCCANLAPRRPPSFALLRRGKQGGGYRMKQYPRVPPRLVRLFPSNPVFFVTMCTHRRRTLLATDAVHASFMQFTERAYAEHNIAVGRYVLMPDHVHLFVTGPDDFDLGQWVGMLKTFLGKSVAREKTLEPLWQRFFDHVLRSHESYAQKWAYVRDNPVRQGWYRTPWTGPMPAK